jgi:hypothetical protein
MARAHQRQKVSESISIAQLGQQGASHSRHPWTRRASGCSSPHSHVDMGFQARPGAEVTSRAQGSSSNVSAQAAQ